jgi:hypothetical protein
MKLRCFIVLGGEIVKISEIRLGSPVVVIGPPFPFGREDEISFILIAESNPAVITKDKLGSYKQRHIPLPLTGETIISNSIIPCLTKKWQQRSSLFGEVIKQVHNII